MIVKIFDSFLILVFYNGDLMKRIADVALTEVPGKNATTFILVRHIFEEPEHEGIATGPCQSLRAVDPRVPGV